MQLASLPQGALQLNQSCAHIYFEIGEPNFRLQDFDVRLIFTSNFMGLLWNCCYLQRLTHVLTWAHVSREILQIKWPVHLSTALTKDNMLGGSWDSWDWTTNTLSSLQESCYLHESDPESKLKVLSPLATQHFLSQIWWMNTCMDASSPFLGCISPESCRVISEWSAGEPWSSVQM